MASKPIGRRSVLRGMGALGGVGLAASVAGCSGQAPGGGATESPMPTDGAPETDTTPETNATTEPPSDASDATVKVASNPTLGDVLVDTDGMTLYAFDPDERGESTCYDDCASAWPPLTVESESDLSAGSGVAASLGTTERDDGSLQVTAAGWPLYYFQGDEARGDANGQGVNDVWWVLGADGTVVRGPSTPTPTPTPGTTSTPTPTTTSYGGYGSDY